MSKILLTGATGFLGGDVLHCLAQASKSITCLIRDSTKAQQVSKAYPNVRTIQGDLDDVTLIEDEAKKSDIVVHLASTRHMPSSEAIARGLSSRPHGGYWIQMSGASMFSIPEIKSSTYGEASSKSYDDLNDAEEILKWIQSNPSRAVDNLVLSQTSIKTALIVGPLIYGKGRGPGNTRSIQVPETAKNTLKEGSGFCVGKGLATWSNIHVQDVSSLIVKLVEAAESNATGLWNREGIYFPENGSMSFGGVSELVAKEAHRQGLIKSPEVARHVSVEEADKIMPHGSILWGTNAILKGSRARQNLGWQPSGSALEDTIAETVKREAE